MKRLRHFFLTRQLREKMLLLAFLGIGAAIWLSAFADRARAQADVVTRTGVDLALHKQWLDQRVRIETAAKAAVENLDPAKSFSAVTLNTEVGRIAGATGLKNYQVGSVVSERTDDFVVNSLQLTARQVDYDALGKFYDELSKRAPYIGLESFGIQAAPMQGANLSVTMKITSIEVVR